MPHLDLSRTEASILLDALFPGLSDDQRREHRVILNAIADKLRAATSRTIPSRPIPPVSIPSRWPDGTVKPPKRKDPFFHKPRGKVLLNNSTAPAPKTPVLRTIDDVLSALGL